MRSDSDDTIQIDVSLLLRHLAMVSSDVGGWHGRMEGLTSHPGVALDDGKVAGGVANLGGAQPNVGPWLRAGHTTNRMTGSFERMEVTTNV